MRSIERARPLLGTIAAIRVYGLEAGRAHRMIDKAFDKIADIHALMSFHEYGSDVSRLNREAIVAPVVVHTETYAVLTEAQALSRASEGCFDISIGAALVERGLLPRPLSVRAPDPRASWRDIELLSDNRVRFHRPLWVDLGGIAKGYAVDCAIDVLRQEGVERACVNAGGDLRVLGDVAELVQLKVGNLDIPEPLVTVADGSLASSGSLARDFASPHIDATSNITPPGRFATVASVRCLIADALTKIVLARGADALALLQRHSAQAFLYGEPGAWISLGVAR